MSPRYLNSREAMAHLGTFYTNAKSWNAAVHRYGIPHRYIGGRLAFEASKLEAWVQTFRPAKRGRKPGVTKKAA
jgi:hypothetical protein